MGRKKLWDPLENEIRSKILRYLESLPDCFAWPNVQTQYSKKGVPDIACIYKGIPILLEVKRIGEKPSAIQELCIKQAREAGAVAKIVYSLDDVIKIMQFQSSKKKMEGNGEK